MICTVRVHNIEDKDCLFRIIHLGGRWRLWLHMSSTKTIGQAVCHLREYPASASCRVVLGDRHYSCAGCRECSSRLAWKIRCSALVFIVELLTIVLIMSLFEFSVLLPLFFVHSPLALLTIYFTKSLPVSCALRLSFHSISSSSTHPQSTTILPILISSFSISRSHISTHWSSPL